LWLTLNSLCVCSQISRGRDRRRGQRHGGRAELLLAAQNGGNPVVQRLAAASASVNSWDALEEMLLAEKGGTAGGPRLEMGCSTEIRRQCPE
jgi:hypothetical protein